MPDIDPAALALSRSGSISINPLVTTKSLATSTPSSQKQSKTHSIAARIDLEPLYTGLKGAVGEGWGIYKEAIGLFLLGHLDQEELSFRIQHLLSTPATLHQHNTLLSAIYGNVTRDLPDQVVASWVSANDKPTNISKPVSGDAAEQRLKTEVKQLPARDRRRIKDLAREAGAHEDPGDFYAGLLVEEKKAKDIRLPDVIPTSAGGLNKTNWELEIRKRYTLPLASETGELPTTASIHERIQPLCYEEGIVSGASNAVSSFLTVATSTFIKEVLSSILSKTRSNGHNYISTHKYRRDVETEEEAWIRGEVAKSGGGLLPVEQKAVLEREPLGLEDVRLACQMGETWAGSMPLMVEKMMNAYLESGSAVTYEQDHDFVNPDGWGNEAAIEEPDWGWEGGGMDERNALDRVLDDCLAVSK